MKRFLVPVIFFLLPFCVKAQEFQCSVSVYSPQVEGTEKKIFQTLQTAINEFINNRKWTNYVYKPEERIECSMMITVSERISSDQFKGRVNIVLQRPVYKTSYNTNLLNLIDKDFEFKYVEYQPLDYSDDAFTSNLTSMLAYYVYMMLGIDADSFSKFGGTPYFEKARAVVNAAQNTPEKGWRSYEGLRNRYWLVENFLNSAYNPLREGLYTYHRTGLDVMSENMDLGRNGINEFLEGLLRVYRERPGLYVVQAMLDAKRDELVNIYSKASAMDKTKAVNTLKEIDPANTSKYEQIMKQND